MIFIELLNLAANMRLMRPKNHRIQAFTIIPTLLAFAFLHCQAQEDETLRLAYSDQKYPAGFYQDPKEARTDLYYENTVSIQALSQRPSTWFELCTDDISQARAWSEASNMYSSQQRALITEVQTEKYFEFQRAMNFHSRVHRCSFLDRGMYDRNLDGFYDRYSESRYGVPRVIGKLNAKPLTIALVKDAVEYLWFIDFYNLSGRNVIDSTGADTGNSITHTLRQTSVVYGDFGICDQVRVIRSDYRVDKMSLEITLTNTLESERKGHCN